MQRNFNSDPVDQIQIGDRVYDRRLGEFGTVVAQHQNRLRMGEHDHTWYDVRMDGYGAIFVYFSDQRELRIVDEDLHMLFCLRTHRI
jgi:hypothetical protein